MDDELRKDIEKIAEKHHGEGFCCLKNDEPVQELLALFQREQEKLIKRIEDGFNSEELLYGEWLKIQRELKEGKSE